MSTKSVQILSDLNALASGRDNYKNLRGLWSNAEPPAIPFLAMTLKDLTFIEDGNPSTLDSGGINFYKWRKLFVAINDCLQYREIPYLVNIDQEIEGYMTQEMAKATEMGDDAIYAASKKLE